MIFWLTNGPVSYTHLDVYKRQVCKYVFQSFIDSGIRKIETNKNF